LGDQGIAEVGSDEACSTCKEYAHGAILGVKERLLCGGVQGSQEALWRLKVKLSGKGSRVLK
jgi:hypothetical protein